jgi:radical SAM superfamily enzyme YgiQ (UPF0313 family)
MNIAILEIQFEDNTIYFPSIHFYLKSYYQKFGKYNDRVIWKTFPFVKDPSADFVNNFIQKEKIEILMCSVYTWNNHQMVALIDQVKKDNPSVKIVFGGPHVMTLFDKNKYFEKYDFIDVAVLGDGETAITEFLDNTIEGKPNKKIIGVAYKNDIENSSYVPARCTKIDSVSPYLDLKEEFIQRSSELDIFCKTHKFIKKIVVDSNRGCPYRCTFCDWGSGTQNKVVKRTTETLFKELTLVLENKFDSLYFADANFGLYDRDVDIIKFLAEYKEKYGYPAKDVSVSYAKTDKAADRILEIFKTGWSAGFFYHFRVDVQDFDQEVLDNIKRKNLSNSELSRMVREIEKDNIPIKTQGMLGLPGQTVEKIIKSYLALLKLNLSANGSDLFVSLPGSEISDPQYKEKYKLKTSNLSVDDGKAICIRALTEDAFKELSDHKVPVMHPNKWQYQEYVTESYSFDTSTYADIICTNRLMTVFEYNWMLKPLRVIHKKMSIDAYEFYDDLFKNLDKLPILNKCVNKGKEQTFKWLSGESDYMKVYKYEDPILNSFNFAMNFENYVMTNLLIYKKEFLQELKNYYKNKNINEDDLETAINLIDMMQIDDGIVEKHERTFVIKGKTFVRKVDPKIHIYQTHDRPYRSMMLSTCYDLKRRLNLYQNYYCNDKKISLNDLNYFVDDFC